MRLNSLWRDYFDDVLLCPMCPARFPPSLHAGRGGLSKSLKRFELLERERRLNGNCLSIRRLSALPCFLTSLQQDYSLNVTSYTRFVLRSQLAGTKRTVRGYSCDVPASCTFVLYHLSGKTTELMFPLADTCLAR